MQAFRLESHDYNGRYLYVECTQEPAVQENKSVIHWTLTVTGGKASYYTTGPTTLKIGEQQVYYSPIVYYNAPKFPAAKGSVSGTVEIAHENDGSKSIEVSLETAIYTSTLKTARATWELDAIPRATTIGATDCYIGSTCMVLLDRKCADYTHEIAFCNPDLDGFLCADGTLSQDPVRHSATAISFAVPTYLYDRIPNERKMECTFLCTTYLGDVQIGDTQRCTFTVSCREEDCIPFVSGEVLDCNDVTYGLTGDRNVIVRFFSRPGCEIYARAKNGAYIAQQTVNGVSIPGEHMELSSPETGTFRFQATDSRGYTAEAVEEKGFVPYQKLTANYTVHREAPTSDRVQLTLFGDFWDGEFGRIVNTLEIKCRAGEREIPVDILLGQKDYIATATIDGLAYDKSTTLSVTVADKLMQHDLLVTVKPGVPVFDWGEGDFVFHVPVTLSDGSPAISQNGLIQVLTQLGLIGGNQ